jgi:hypothetical protein
MSQNKTGPTKMDVAEFINSVQNETRRKDGVIILNLMNRITNLKPTMWGTTVIGYGHYRYKTKSGHEGEAILIGFAPRKHQLVLYVLNNLTDQLKLLDKLGKYKTG